MGAAMLPRMVLATFPQQALLKVYPLPTGLAKAPTVMVWRKGTQSPKVTALLQVLTADVAANSAPAAPKGGRKRHANGSAKAA
jgi:DNA-binding transcriptional LysR family regulator